MKLKRFIAAAVALSVIGGALSAAHATALPALTASAAAASGTCGDDMTWTYSGGTLTISGTGEMYEYEYSKTPWFSYNSKINTVVVEEGVTVLTWYAFGECLNLSSVSLPDSLEYLPASVFYADTELASIKLPENITEIRQNAFWNCRKLASVEIPGSVTSIEERAFFNCDELQSVTVYSPECAIYDSEQTFDNYGGTHTPGRDICFEGTIRGYANSTAQAYAEKYGYSFESLGDYPGTANDFMLGDVNADCFVDSADASLILVLNADGAELTEYQSKAGDINGDGMVDPVDASLILAYNAYVADSGTLSIAEWKKTA